MRTFWTYTWALCLGLLTSLPLAAQDFLYIKDGSRLECKISSTTGQAIRYKIAQNLSGPDYLLPKNKLLMWFYGDGSIGVVDESQAESMRTFGPGNGNFDRILLADNEFSFVNILQLDDSQIEFRKASLPGGPPYTRPVSDLLLIVRKNGSHELFAEASRVANALKNARVNAEIPSPAREPDPVPVPQPVNEVEWNVSEEDPNLPPDEEPVDPPQMNEVPLVTDPEPVPAGETLEVDLEEFSAKALDKVRSLGNYFQIISDKETPWQEANDAIDLALELFLNEESQVEVSSTSSPEKRSYPIRRYLERLKMLQYDQVEITWSEINYVSNLRKGSDGNYYGVISFLQKFTGYREGRPVYSDLTRKNIQVVLKGISKETLSGTTVETWDVFLSDIGVINTRAN